MFRTQQNAFDEVVGKFHASVSPVRQVIKYYTAKATDENLTSENWETILVNLQDGYEDVPLNKTRMSAIGLLLKILGPSHGSVNVNCIQTERMSVY